MRTSAVFAIFCVFFSAPAAALETARGLAAAGAPHLALARVEQLQPRDPGGVRWAEWEVLHLNLLVELKRNDEVLKRVAGLPANLAPTALRQCLIAAARAAVASGQGAAARAYAARLLWQFDLPVEETRVVRLLVIDSFLAERQGDAAFRAMLRFDQDYRPLDRDVAGRFVESLLGLGLEKEAVNWLAGLDDASALKLQLRVRAGLSAPDTIAAQARAQIAKGGGPEYWQVLSIAAAKQGDGASRVEALERLLHYAPGSDPAQAESLWQAYGTEAQAAANQNRLLTGDDNGWLDFAARRLGASPPQSRAVYAHLARAGKIRETRLGAQLQLVFSLYQGGLDRAALRLFDDERLATDALDPQARYLLGNMAETRNAASLAVRFWQALPAPPNVAMEEWHTRVATMQWRAGQHEASMVTMRALFKQAKTMPDTATARAATLAREMFASGKPELAEEVYAGLLPLVTEKQQRGQAREILYALGGIAETAARYAQAADYFLRAALADESRPSDALALQARHAAGANLARAGHREDARAQYQWLLKNAKDPAQIETVRRELERL
jgi:hypothetical protein